MRGDLNPFSATRGRERTYGLIGNGAFRITSFTDLYPPGGGGCTAGVVVGRTAVGSFVSAVRAGCRVSGSASGAGPVTRRTGVTRGCVGRFDSMADTTLVPCVDGASSIVPAETA